MFDEELISGEVLRPLRDRGLGVRVWLRLPWYRSLPLSCIEQIEVEIDGERVADNGVSLSLYGYDHPLSDLPALHDIWWFVLDAADVAVHTQAPLPLGDHQVDVTMQCRIPYNADREFTQVARCSRLLPLLED